MMKIETLVSPAVDWVGGTWVERIDQAASLLFCHGYITQRQREKITLKIERQFENGLRDGRIVELEQSQ